LAGRTRRVEEIRRRVGVHRSERTFGVAGTEPRDVDDGAIDRRERTCPLEQRGPGQKRDDSRFTAIGRRRFPRE
jgi:hypothetical protein